MIFIEENQNPLKSVIIMLIIFVLMTITGFIISYLIEPKLQLQRGKIIDYELQENDGIDTYMDNLADKKDYFRTYEIKDDKTGEVSTIRSDNIMFPYNLFIDLFNGKSIIYSTYKNAVLYNIMLGWKIVGFLGIGVCTLCIIKNPYKEEN